MKKYRSRYAKGFAVPAVISCIALIVGIFMLIFGYPDSSVSCCLIILGGIFSGTFLPIFISELSTFLIIDTDKVIFPRGVKKNDKAILKKSVVKFDEMNSFECESYKGDGIFTGDTNIYTLKLKGSVRMTMTLYCYGKDEEDEIYETIRQRISESKSERRRNKKKKSQPK